MHSDTFILFMMAVGVIGFLTISRLSSTSASIRGIRPSETPLFTEKNSTEDSSLYGAPCQTGTASDIESQGIAGVNDELACGSPYSTDLLLKRTVSRLGKLLDCGSKSLQAKRAVPASTDLQVTASEKTVRFADFRYFTPPTSKVTKSAPYIELHATPTCGTCHMVLPRVLMERAIPMSAQPIPTP